MMAESFGIVFAEVMACGLPIIEDIIIGEHAGSGAHDVVSADIDCDGDLDIISTASHNETSKSLSIVWWENRLNNEQ